MVFDLKLERALKLMKIRRSDAFGVLFGDWSEAVLALRSPGICGGHEPAAASGRAASGRMNFGAAGMALRAA